MLGIAGTACFGVAAIVAVMAATLFLILRRRRAAHACATAPATDGPVLVAAPARRPSGDGS